MPRSSLRVFGCVRPFFRGLTVESDAEVRARHSAGSTSHGYPADLTPATELRRSTGACATGPGPRCITIRRLTHPALFAPSAPPNCRGLVANCVAQSMHAEVLRHDGVVHLDLGRRSREHHRARVEDDDIVGQIEREPDV